MFSYWEFSDNIYMSCMHAYPWLDEKKKTYNQNKKAVEQISIAPLTVKQNYTLFAFSLKNATACNCNYKPWA